MYVNLEPPMHPEATLEMVGVSHMFRGKASLFANTMTNTATARTCDVDERKSERRRQATISATRRTFLSFQDLAEK